MAHESILALGFDGSRGLIGKMQNEIPSGTRSVLSAACCSPTVYETSFVLNQVEYNTAAFSPAR